MLCYALPLISSQWWCGLRGAVAYAMAVNMPIIEYASKDEKKDAKVQLEHIANPAVESSTLIVVILTTFVFGMLTAPVLSYLGKMKKKKRKKKRKK